MSKRSTRRVGATILWCLAAAVAGGPTVGLSQDAFTSSPVGTATDTRAGARAGAGGAATATQSAAPSQSAGYEDGGRDAFISSAASQGGLYGGHPAYVGPNGHVSRGTLFQWSYGTSFAGGPDLDEPLVTDRPDFTEASSTVGKGVAQIEFGYTYTYDAEDGTSERSNSWGEPLLRYGIFADWLELRLALFPVDERTTTGGTSNTTGGTEDLYFGFKIGLTPQEGLLPEMALIPQMSIPTGSPALTDDEVLPGVNWIYGWEINDTLSIAGSTQGNRVVDEISNQPYFEIAQSMTAAYTLADALGAYTEWYALFPHSADTAKPEYYFNGGFTVLLSDDVQFDARAGVGLNSAADDYFVGTGLSIRFK